MRRTHRDLRNSFAERNANFAGLLLGPRKLVGLGRMMTGASAPQGDHLGNLEESPGSAEGLGTVDPVGAPEIYSKASAYPNPYR